jgi:hypothetical protein
MQPHQNLSIGVTHKILFTTMHKLALTMNLSGLNLHSNTNNMYVYMCVNINVLQTISGKILVTNVLQMWSRLLQSEIKLVNDHYLKKLQL